MTVLRRALGRAAASTAPTGSSTGAPTTRPRSPTSRSSTSRSTTRSSTPATRSSTAPASITIATVRPATILADVAVAVHPDDPRYRDAVGREVVVPVVGRQVPVIADERVELDFGSGALKITPGHDPLDFEIGRDHRLETLTVIGPDGRMSAEAGELRRADPGGGRRARRRLARGARPARRAREPPPRGRDLRALPLADRAARLAAVVVRDGRAGRACASRRSAQRRVRFHPESQHRFAIDSLENAPDWCVSRQLWWGHQIPIWTCPDGHRTCTWPPPEACAECGTAEIERETATSSTPGSPRRSGRSRRSAGPSDTPELGRYYPANVNVTAREIIRLWENRMIFSGLFLLGEVPFTDVIITSTVLAPDGRRMSKSLGTGIDPLEAVARHGADATRYGLLKISSTQDVRFSWGAIDEGAKLASKLWNVARLILANGRRASSPTLGRDSLEERWIVVAARRDTRRELEEALPQFRLRRTSSTALYHLTFDDFCDWYAEAVKPRLHAGDARRAWRPRSRRSSGCSPLLASGDAARDRGDLVAVPRRPAHPRPVAAADPGRPRRRSDGPRPAQARRDFRRSGELVPLARRRGAADLRRRRHARAARHSAQRSRSSAERERLSREIARSEWCSRTSAFVAEGARRGRRGRA